MAALAALAALLLGACGTGAAPRATISAAPAAPRGPAHPATPPKVAPGSVAPVVATTPEGLADQLAAVEAAIRNPATPAADLETLGHTEQLATGSLATHPEWQDQVLAKLPPAAKAAVTADVRAYNDLTVLASGEPQGLPDWHIVAPPPAPELLADYKAAQSSTGVPWQYLAAINLVESRMGRIRGDSSAGAQGPMQFLPSTWAQYGNGGDINSYPDAILAAARLLRADGAPADMAGALYHYNPSNRYVDAITAYAGQMQADERAFFGYYDWQVYYFNTWLPEGYGS